MAKKAARISVRTMVEFVLRGEDLQTGSAVLRMQEGTRAHRAREQHAMDTLDGYSAEVSLALDVEIDGFPLCVIGRADGVHIDGATLIVEEIKLSYTELSQPVPVHMAQCACYAHILCQTQGWAEATLRILYADTSGKALSVFEFARSSTSLAEEFMSFARVSAAFMSREARYRELRDASLRTLQFPYGAFRAGQREMSANVYVAIRDKKRLLAQAPTGTGKTSAALFPALKALGEGKSGQLFYLTAKTTGRALALSCLRDMNATLRVVEITAKDKLCPQPIRSCSPENCPYARGYFLRIDDAIDEALLDSFWDREAVNRIGRKHMVCPFELSLALLELADVVVCDYNYAFDPFVRIQRVTASKMTLLVDEAHNLPDRARDMLSSEVSERALRETRRAWGKSFSRKGGLYSALTSCIRQLANSPEDPVALAPPMQKLCDAAGEALAKTHSPLALELFLLARGYVMCVQRLDDTYAVLCDGADKARRIRLLCLQPAPYLLETTRKMRGVVYFSATLSPLDAFKTLLGTNESDAALSLPSPFVAQHLCVLRLQVDTRYGARARTAMQVAQSLLAMIKPHPGNYLALFPSYQYLRSIRECFEALESDAFLLSEEPGMSEEERSAFLAHFLPDTKGRVLGFAVMGGAFAEGIDLPGERLSGVAVVGVGLPQLSSERDALRSYFDKTNEDGFHLAYRVPGMIRVLQAVGRVIRTDNDRGVALLMDERFFTHAYAQLMPPHFAHIKDIYGASEVEAAVEAFYGDAEG